MQEIFGMFQPSSPPYPVTPPLESLPTELKYRYIYQLPVDIIIIIFIIIDSLLLYYN